MPSAQALAPAQPSPALPLASSRTVLSRRALLSTGLLVLLPGCAAEVGDERERWLHETLVRDNQVFFERSPSLAEGKIAVMGESLYALVRGTVPQFNADSMVPGGAARVPTRYLTPETRSVAILGDPHPENLSSYRTAGGVMTLEFGDFDGATFGPYIQDVRRFALSMWMAVEEARRMISARGGAPVLEESHRDEVVETGARAYAEAIVAMADGEPGVQVDRRRRWGAIADELLERAETRGRQRDRLRAYTTLKDGVRQLAFKDVEPRRTARVGAHEHDLYSDTLVEVSASEQRLLRRLFEAYRTTLVDPSYIDPRRAEIVGFGRRLGGGVSSYPNARYYLLVYGVGPEPDEAVLLELKEVIDAAPLPGLARFPEAPHTSNAERVGRRQRLHQAALDTDPWLGWATAGAQSFRVRERSGNQRNYAIDRMADGLREGELRPSDVLEFAQLAGQILARSHAQAHAQSGKLAGPLIARAIGGDVSGFTREAVDFTSHYAQVVVADLERLHRLITEHGFHLGYRR
ncbi:MAG: DUF2252 family protein [Polyangiaceae bacterium]|nr:DUF2252 family protein [Polyangiaceae bacterium]MCW5792214.1 DUF2252 family protein [Polyangiaceae bacterium]